MHTRARSRHRYPHPLTPVPIRWTPERYDQLERAARDGRRVVLARRGTEYVVIAVAVRTTGRREVLVGRLPMTGEEMEFPLEEIDTIEWV
jgi:hypothetical protein